MWLSWCRAATPWECTGTDNCALTSRRVGRVRGPDRLRGRRSRPRVVSWLHVAFKDPGSQHPTTPSRGRGCGQGGGLQASVAAPGPNRGTVGASVGQPDVEGQVVAPGHGAVLGRRGLGEAERAGNGKRPGTRRVAGTLLSLSEFTCRGFSTSSNLGAPAFEGPKPTEACAIASDPGPD